MKKIIALITICLALWIGAYTQSIPNANLLDTLQQIANTNTPSVPFAKLYMQSIKFTNEYAYMLPDSVKHFIVGFEQAFVPFFFLAHNNYLANKAQAESWKTYYANTTLTEMQYLCLGMNAQINGYSWQAYKNTYCYDTIYKYKTQILKFQKPLNSLFDSMYKTTYQYKKLRHIHHLTFGLDKVIGKHIILKWRKQQLQLALLWYSNNAKCLRKVEKLNKKMKRLDKFIIKHLK